MDPVELVTEAGRSLVGQQTSISKLNGQVYTPDDLAERVLGLLNWPASPQPGRLLDPACGQGVFLEAAMRAVAANDWTDDEKRYVITQNIAGWDLDLEALTLCEERLSEVAKGLGLPGALPKLVHCDALDQRGQAADYVVGNPPYVEAKRMADSQKAKIKARCPLAARGSFDLYGAFVELSQEWVGETGRMAFIIPNRFLVVKYAEKLRQHFLKTAAMGVVDLSQENVFADAAVYPIVLHLQFGVAPQYRVGAFSPDGVEGITLQSDLLLARLDGRLPVVPNTAVGQALVERLLTEPRFRSLATFGDVRWCVSFHKGGLRDSYVFNQPPDNPKQLRKFLGGGRFQGNREVEAHRIDWAGWWIDYDEDRARADKNPLPPLALFDAPKLVICQNARRLRAAVDRSGLILKDTFVALVPNDATDDAWLDWASVVLQSDVMHYLYEHLYAGTRKGGSYLHFLRGYLLPLPIPPMPEDGALVADAIAQAQDSGDFSASEALVQAAFGLTAQESAEVARYELPLR